MLTANQLMTIVMLWNNFKALDLDYGGEVWIEFRTMKYPNGTRITITRKNDGTPESPHETFYLSMNAHGLELSNVTLGTDCVMSVKDDMIQFTFDSPDLYRMPVLELDTVTNIGMTQFDGNCDIVLGTSSYF